VRRGAVTLRLSWADAQRVRQVLGAAVEPGQDIDTATLDAAWRAIDQLNRALAPATPVPGHDRGRGRP
jgi:hypothetical protein